MESYQGKPYSESSKPSNGESIEGFEDGCSKVEVLIDRLRALGVELTIEGGGLVFDAPEGVLSAELIAEMKAHRSKLIAAVKHRDAPEMDPIRGVYCPFCRGGRFEDVYMGWRCVKCDRLAWCWLGGSLVRFDVERPKL